MCQFFLEHKADLLRSDQFTGASHFRPHYFYFISNFFELYARSIGRPVLHSRTKAKPSWIIMNRAKERVAETLDLAALKWKFVEWIASKLQKKLNILITGKTGVGKSRLVNALVGKYVAKEGDDKQSCTAVETPYVADIEGIEVVIWDSRGLQDGTDNDEDYLNSLKDINLESGGFDIVIYCHKMDDTRFRRDDKDAIRMLTSSFGKDLWKKTVVALTFANTRLKLSANSLPIRRLPIRPAEVVCQFDLSEK